jgi:large subunit ribosomal protein L21
VTNRKLRGVYGEVKIGESNMKYAIVENGGKQYRAIEGSTIEVDRMEIEIGQQLSLGSVLLLVDGDNVAVGAPVVGGARVSTTVVEHVKGPKIVVFRYRPKKRYRVKTGHRQQYTRLLVNSIEVE